MTDSGRFETGTSICLTISEHHPESWNPALTARSIITALLSFMCDDEHASGVITTTSDKKKQIAKGSMTKVMAHQKFKELFTVMGSHIGLGDIKAP